MSTHYSGRMHTRVESTPVDTAQLSQSLRDAEDAAQKRAIVKAAISDRHVISTDGICPRVSSVLEALHKAGEAVIVQVNWTPHWAGTNPSALT